MGAPTYAQYWPVAAKRWTGLTLRAGTVAAVRSTAARLCSYKARYQTIEKKTGVPWYVIAVLHERESSANFSKQLAQGWALTSKSRVIPYVGPFASFEDSAVWALGHDHLSNVVDWRIEKILYYCELWNGWGYWMYHPSCPSPYVWGATSVQRPGKYTGDGVYSSTVWDTQLGCAAMLLEMAKIDTSIQFRRETPKGTPGDEKEPLPPPRPNATKDKRLPVPPTTVDGKPYKPGFFSKLWGWLNS